MKQYRKEYDSYIVVGDPHGTCIPPDPNNMDYARMLEEVAAGTSEVRDEAGDIVVID